ncbi:MAG: 5-oxoprolinase subunit PxpB [Acidobacteria bacterium]|nr:5-oxoprolinase subunit PxpB [Acidobacteriota bacterium]
MPTLYPLGDHALLVDWGQRLDAAVNGEVHRLARALRARRYPGMEDVVPAYASLALHWDPEADPDGGDPMGVWEARIARLLAEEGETAEKGHRTVEIPVRYGGGNGPDLGEAASVAGMSEKDYAARHAAGLYRVYMLGFTPGFPYLGGLDPALAAPRRATPRSRVPAGSVGIAGLQTGIYPSESPGGWQLIGRTDAVLFDPLSPEPALLGPGDQVRFLMVEGPP